MTVRDERGLLERDAEARLVVRTRFRGVIVLEAGAGTGKTTTLVARVLAWLLEPGFESARAALGDETDPARIATRALEGILAITFTEAAAADMDQKIRAALAELEAGRAPTGLGDHAFAAPVDELRARAAHLRRALDRPLARTIHAWCRALLSEHALAAGLHPHFDLDVDGRLVREVAREEVVRDLAERLRDPAEREWHLLSRRNVGPGSVLDALVRLVIDGARAEDLERDPFTPDVVRGIEDELRRAARAFAAECAAPLRSVSGGSAKYAELCDDVEKLLARIADDNDSATELAARAQTALLLVGDYARKKLAAFAAGEVPKKLADESGEFGRRLGERSRALSAALADYLRFDPALDEAARGLLARLLGATRAALVRAGVETFGDLLRDARALLLRRADVCARVRARLEQVLVDEFQDTDPIQCDLVAALALSDPPARRPGLLIVGDPKQSIYGFRRADLRAYEAFVERALASGGERHVLSRNFRSQQPILDHVERIMREAMVEEPGVQPRFQPLVAAREPGAFRIEHWNAVVGAGTRGPGVLEARAEAGFLARELHASHERGVEWHEMGVLMRTRAPLETLLEALRAAAIPFDVVGDRSYYRRREVVDAAALVAAVVDPSDLLALVAFLRSPWVGVPDALWLPLRGEDGFFTHVTELDARAPAALSAVRAALARVLQREAGRAAVDRLAEASFRPALEHALESLALLRASFATEPSDVFLERLRTLLLPEATSAARYQGAYRVANLERFFHEISVELEDSGGDVVRLLRTVRGAITDALDAGEARPHDTGRSAVRIQTIHAAKGLDYREVFVLGLRATSRARSNRHERTRVLGDAHVLFGAPSPAWIEHERHEERREAAERVRLLYVAMTRAKDRLVLSGALPPARSSDDTEPDGTGGMLGLLRPAWSRQAAFLRGETDDAVLDLEEDGVGYRVVRGDEVEKTTTASAIDTGAWAERARADAAHLAQAARTAAARSMRPPVRAMSAGPERGEAWTRSLRATRLAPGAAALAGSAVHAVLERLPLTGDLEAALALAHERLDESVRHAARSSGVHDASSCADAAARAREILGRVRTGPLARELARIAPHVVAREFALLAAAGDPDGFHGVSSGTIDLLVRDPGTGTLVIIDFKTDAVSNATEARSAARGHRQQMQSYRDALAAALDLSAPPRTELWFLAAGEIVAIE